MKKKKANIKLILLLASVAALAIILGLQFYSHASMSSIVTSQKKLIAETRISTEVNALESDVRSIESKLQSYILTGDKSFLSGEETNEAEARNEAATLKTLCQNDQEKELARAIASLLDKKIASAGELLKVYQVNGVDSASRLMRTGNDRRIVMDLETLCDSLQYFDKNDTDQILYQNYILEEHVRWMDIVGIVLIIVVIGASTYFAFRDIDQREQANRELQIARQKAIESANLKENFMANMSHEIRTPLNAIIGFANRLSKSEQTPEQKEFTANIQSSGQSLLSIVNDILDFSKLEAGMIRLEEIEFSIFSLLQSMQVMFGPRTDDKNLQLEIHPLINVPERVVGDPTRLTQILGNLISNAIKFTDEGKIEVFVKKLKEDEEHLLIQFTVKDSGIGIPADKLNTVFERFEQASSDTARKYGGTGLGLSIVKNLVEQQGGMISVDSEKGKGAAFTFTIYYRKAKSAVSKNHDLHYKESAGKLELIPGVFKVLIVEDSQLNQRLITLLLKEWGLDFDLVFNGRMAIEALKKEKYGIVLMDIQMPEMNGYDTSRIIRDELNLNVPIIATSAHALPGELEKCRSYGMNDYIAKPFDESLLYSLIAQYASPHITQKKKKKNDALPVPEMKVVNLERLYELADGDLAFIEEMKEIFLVENPEEIRQIEESISSRDFNRVYHTVHKMKSTISFMGLSPLLQPDLEKLETLCKNGGDIPAMQSILAKVKTVCEEAAEELKS